MINEELKLELLYEKREIKRIINKYDGIVMDGRT